MSVVKLENVSFVYGKKTPYEIHALENVNLSIEENIITGIIGHTGSGKSTLVQMFNGLIKPDEGNVFVDGENIWDKPKQISKVRYKVGMVMQYPEYQLFAETVREDIAYGPKNMGLEDDEIAHRVAKSAQFCGLNADVLDKSPFDLSGGQKRRVALAGVMAMDPKLLVLDEPMNSLDTESVKEIRKLFLELNHLGTTIILASHISEDIETLCKKIYRIENTEIKECDKDEIH